MVNLVWVPGHSGVLGNETIDILANKLAKSAFIGPEPGIAVSPSTLKSHINQWNIVNIARQAKNCISINTKIARYYTLPEPELSNTKTKCFKKYLRARPLSYLNENGNIDKVLQTLIC